MDRTRLLQHFDTLAETPEAVVKLRKLVLELAVQGRLMPHDLNEKPAIHALPKQNEKNAFAVAIEDEPFTIPSNWSWVTLKSLGLTQTGTTPPSDDPTAFGSDTPFIKPADIYPDRVNYANEGLSHKGVQEYGRLASKGSILMVCIGTIGKSNLITRDCSFNQQINSLTPAEELDSQLINYFMRSPYFQSEAWARSNSTTISILNKGNWERIPFPLPPIAEQRRIVAKVDELLALCDELETRQTAAREHRTRLVHSALDHLTTGVRPSPVAATSARTRVSEKSNARRPHHAAAPEDGRTPDDFRRHAAFVLNAFPDLTAAPEDVPALRQTILALAVQGRLVPENPKDGSGTDVVSKFSLRELLNADHILDLALPAHWAITAFSNLARIRSGVTKGRNLTDRKTKAFPYLRVANVQRGFLDLDFMKNIEIPVEELERFRLEANDLLVTEGGDWDKVGRTAIWREEVADCIHQNHVFRARLVSDELKPEWFMLYLNSPVGRRYFESAAKKTTNLASINATELRGCPVPIPPLAEQQRIVAKVDELMRWCDALEARLTTARTTATRLLDATLHQILGA